nr:MAG TPA: hypothetical protein [Caudoviricetes sp.]
MSFIFICRILCLIYRNPSYPHGQDGERELTVVL